MRLLSCSGLVFISIAFICGCTPEETFVLVDAPSLRQAVNGGLASAKVEMVFAIKHNDDPTLPGRIKRVALPYLGSGATIEIEKTEMRRVREGGSIRDEEIELTSSLDDAKIVACFTIPVGTEEVLEKAQRSILWLKYTPSDKSFRLVPGNAVNAMNSAISDMDGGVGISFDYTGGTSHTFSDANGTTIKIVGDESVKVGVAAVKVNGERFLAGTVSPQSGSVKINYDNQFYDTCAPCFIFGGIPMVPAEKFLDESSIWD